MPNCPVFINHIECLNCSTGTLSELIGNAPSVAPVELSFYAEQKGYLLNLPALPSGVFDRKIQRNIEPQAHRLLYCVSRLSHLLEGMEIKPERLGLTAGIPEVDAPSPGWDAVAAIHTQPAQLLTQLFTNTPPLHALMMLNSSVIAYVAEAFNCHGAMAGFCSQNNAGIDAIVEAYHQLHTGVTDATLVVSSSANITPALYLRNKNQRQFNFYGEGAAALIMSSVPVDGALCLLGFIRGFSSTEETFWEADVISRLLASARINSDALDFVIGDVERLGNIQQLESIPLYGSVANICGDLGPSTPLTDLFTVMQLFNSGLLKQQNGYALLITQNADGYYSALLVGHYRVGGLE